jgi:hypothetical protein
MKKRFTTCWPLSRTANIVNSIAHLMAWAESPQRELSHRNRTTSASCRLTIAARGDRSRRAAMTTSTLVTLTIGGEPQPGAAGSYRVHNPARPADIVGEAPAADGSARGAAVRRGVRRRAAAGCGERAVGPGCGARAGAGHPPGHRRHLADGWPRDRSRSDGGRRAGSRRCCWSSVATTRRSSGPI